jgi:hypothetical protein
LGWRPEDEFAGRAGREDAVVFPYFAHVPLHPEDPVRPFGLVGNEADPELACQSRLGLTGRGAVPQIEDLAAGKGFLAASVDATFLG